MSLLHRIIHRVALPLATFGLDRDDRPTDNSLLDSFILCCQAMNRPRVLELGTKRSVASRSTLHDDWVPNAREYLGTDIESDADVDIVADAHRLTQVTGEEQFDVLTPRELEVLKLIAEAHTSKQISEALFISVKTVERHRQNILDKLGMRDRVELTRYAIRRGLTQP